MGHEIDVVTRDEPAVALRVRPEDEAGIEVRINFGVFAGRTVTPAEIDDLARRVSAHAPR